MRASTAYFAGAGTIIAAIVLGLGGGLIAGNVLNPTSPRQVAGKAPPGKLERKAEPAAAPAVAAAPPGLPPSDPVPYVDETERAGFGAVLAAQPAAATKSADANTAGTSSTGAAAGQQPSPAASAPENAYAKARDSDVKAAEQRRRAERHQRWVERHRQERRERRDADARDQRGRDSTDWSDVERNVHEDSDARDRAAPRDYAPRRAYRPDQFGWFSDDEE